MPNPRFTPEETQLALELARALCPSYPAHLCADHSDEAKHLVLTLRNLGWRVEDGGSAGHRRIHRSTDLEHRDVPGDIEAKPKRSRARSVNA